MSTYLDLNELKVTLSIILVSCIICFLYEYVRAVLAVAHYKSRRTQLFNVWVAGYGGRNTEDVDFSVPDI